MRKKLITAIIALSLVLSTLVGITVAWLSVKTENVVNTFTPSDITITLNESDYLPTTNTLDTANKVMENKDYKMVPGVVLPKDPTVTVQKGSEACWLFIKVTKATNTDTFLSYSIDSNIWTELEDGVYYCKVDANTNADQTFNVLANKQVTVKSEVTKKMMNDLTSNPTLTFTAYAIQQAGFETAADAWTEAQKLG